MLRNIAFVARAEIKHLFKDWEMYFWTFAMPLLFMYFIGTVTSGNANPTGGASNDPIALVAPSGSGFLADELARKLEAGGLAVQRVDSLEASEEHARRLVVPDDFTRRVLGGEKTVVRFLRTDEGTANDYDRFRVSRAVYTLLADLAVCAKDGRPPDAAALERLARMPRSLTVEVQPAGRRAKPPTGFEQAVPGILTMFTMLAMLSGGSVLVVFERRQGLLKRLASAPLGRGELFVGKWLGRLALGVVQIAFCMIAGSLLFGMAWGPALPMVVVVLLAWGALCASFGMVLGNLVQTEAQGIGVAVLATNALSALGGQWWPIEIAPNWMQAIARCLPTGWVMDAMHQLISFRAGATSAVVPLAALSVSTIAAIWLGARTFRYQ